MPTLTMPRPTRYRLTIVRHSDGFQQRLSREHFTFTENTAQRRGRRRSGPVVAELTVLEVQRPSSREYHLVGESETWRLTGCGCGS